MPDFVEILVVVKDASLTVFSVTSTAGIIHLYFHRKWEQEVNLMDRLTKAETALENGNESANISAVQSAIQVARESKRLSREKSLRIRNRVAEDICSHLRKTTGSEEYQLEHKHHLAHKEKPSSKVQTILKQTFVLNGDVFEDCKIDLHGSYLKGADLNNARLRGANFSEAQLQGAKFMFAQLQDANFKFAQMQWAALALAQSQGANFSYAKLQGATFTSAKLQGTDFSHAMLQIAKFSDAELQGANFDHAELQGAKLSNAHLEGVCGDENRLSFFTPPLFHVRIMSKVQQVGSHLRAITFSGGLDEEKLNNLCVGLSSRQEEHLRKEMACHVGIDASHELPTNSDDGIVGTITGYYTKKDAKRWIAEYNEGIPLRRRIAAYNKRRIELAWVRREIDNRH